MATRVNKNGLTDLKKRRKIDVTCETTVIGWAVCYAMWKSHLETRKYQGYSKKEAIKKFIEEVCS